jgi:hypothetical protein
VTELDQSEIVIRATIARKLFDELVQEQKFDVGQALYLLPSLLTGLLPFAWPKPPE